MPFVWDLAYRRGARTLDYDIVAPVQCILTFTVIMKRCISGYEKYECDEYVFLHTFQIHDLNHGGFTENLEHHVTQRQTRDGPSIDVLERSVAHP